MRRPLRSDGSARLNGNGVRNPEWLELAGDRDRGAPHGAAPPVLSCLAPFAAERAP
jgi:hypothetical protein